MSSSTSGPRQTFDEHARAGLHQKVVAGAEPFSPARPLGELAHPLLVGTADHERAPSAVEQLLERDDLARDVVAPCEHHVERLVQHDLLAALELVDVELRMHRDAHLATGA